MAVGVLGISPRDFWEMTPIEIFMAVDGYNEANRVKPKPMTKAEANALFVGTERRPSIRKKAKPAPVRGRVKKKKAGQDGGNG